MSSRLARLLWGFVVMVGLGCGGSGSREATASQAAAEGADCREGTADPAGKGPYAAGFSYFVLEDSSRSDDLGGVRQIPVHLWYPVDPKALGPSAPEAVYPLDPIYAPGHTATSSEAEAYGIDRAWQDPPASRRGPFPLVLLSPGWGQDPTFYSFHATRLASHGFVVAGMTHAGDGDFVTSPSTIPAVKVAYDRPRDMSVVLTRLLADSASRGRWHGLIDPHQVAAMGHSFGGYAALALAGGDDDACDAVDELFGEDYHGPLCAGVVPDPRIRAVVRLDASEWALSWQELGRVRVPTITLNEDTDAFAPVCPGDNARGHAAIASPVNLRVDVIHSNHQSFTRLCDWIHLYQAKQILGQADADLLTSYFCTDPDPSNGGFPLLDPHAANGLVARTVIAFLKTHLTHEPGYARFLSPSWIWDEEPGLGLFRTETGGESHYGTDQIVTCLPKAFLETEPGFDFYWYMPEPDRWR
jgi:predicted dienelactone hydrolase